MLLYKNNAGGFADREKNFGLDAAFGRFAHWLSTGIDGRNADASRNAHVPSDADRDRCFGNLRHPYGARHSFPHRAAHTLPHACADSYLGAAHE